MTNLDFTVTETNNCKTLGIIDTSTYATGLVISEPTITVYMPGSSVPVALGLVPRKVNIFNSNNLDITCADAITGLINLNDGIYKIVYTIKPSTTYSVEKTFLRACNLTCKLENALLKLDILDCDDDNKRQKINKFKEIEFMILSAHANARKCNHELAIQLYQKADKQLDRMLNC